MNNKIQISKIIKKLKKMKKFLNLFSRKCTNSKVQNFRIISRPNPNVYNLQWNNLGVGNEYIISVKFPNGMLFNFNVIGTSYQLVIQNPDGRHEITVKKKCSCSTQSLPSKTIFINPCAQFFFSSTSNNSGGAQAGTGFYLIDRKSVV